MPGQMLINKSPDHWSLLARTTSLALDKSRLKGHDLQIRLIFKPMSLLTGSKSKIRSLGLIQLNDKGLGLGLPLTGNDMSCT